MLEWIGNIPVGRWLFLGFILVPIYAMLLAWFLGKPRNLRVAFRGIVYLFGTVVFLWANLTVITLIIKVLFY